MQRVSQLQKTQVNKIEDAYAYDADECISPSMRESLGMAWHLDVGRSWRKLEARERQILLEMTWSNMAQYYGSRWTEEKSVKRRDMANKDARYLIVREKESDSIAGFCNYRFVVEDQWVVLYVYELQICEAHQRKGLGRVLLNLAESIAKRTKMDGVMLTALKCNHKALHFYEKNKYVKSSIDPTVMGFEWVDYSILCKLFSL